MALYRGGDCSAECIIQHGRSGAGYVATVGTGQVLANEVFLIQVGGDDENNPGGVATLTVSAFDEPCLAANVDMFEDNDTVATAVVLSAGTYNGLFASSSDPDFYSITIPVGEHLLIDMDGDFPLHAALLSDSGELLLPVLLHTWATPI